MGFEFKTIEIAEVLRIYSSVSGQQLVMASNVTTAPYKITLQSGGLITYDEVARLLQRGLLEQAGIVITRLDDKRASVTYNDRLSVKQLK